MSEDEQQQLIEGNKEVNRIFNKGNIIKRIPMMREMKCAIIENNKVEVSCEDVEVFCVYHHDNKQYTNTWKMAKKGPKATFILEKGIYDICGYRRDHKGSNICYMKVQIK